MQPLGVSLKQKGYVRSLPNGEATQSTTLCTLC